MSGRSAVRPCEAVAVVSSWVNGNEELPGLLLQSESDEEPVEERKPRRMLDPIKTQTREVEEHELTHLPYRSWCWICVHGKAKNAHHKIGKNEKMLPEIHFDFMFMGHKDEPGETVTCLVAREAITRMTLATVIPDKSTNEFVVQRTVAFLEEIWLLASRCQCQIRPGGGMQVFGGGDREDEGHERRRQMDS